MQQLKPICVFSLIFLSISCVFAEDLIGQICRSTPDFRVCQSYLRSDPRSSTADTKGLIEIMIDVVNSKFIDSLSYVNKLLKQSPKPAAKEKALKMCASTFKVVSESDIRVAKDAVKLGDPKFGVDAMRDASGVALDCKDAISSSGGESKLIEQTKLLDVISNIAASMIATLQ